MRQSTFTRRLLYWLSVAAGLVLAIVPLPDWLSPARPDLALLAVLYFILTSPRIAGLGSAWLPGLPPDVAVGGYLVAEENGEERVWRVTSIAEGKAVLDGNHELAGQRLRFDATVVEIRPATQEEIAHGHVHGPHGHQH